MSFNMSNYVRDVYKNKSFKRGTRLLDAIPELESYWNYDRNESDINNLTYGSKDKIMLFCDKGHMFESTPKRIKEGSWCRTCAIIIRAKNNRRTNDDFLSRLHEKHGKKYIPLEEYTGVKTNINLECSICKRVFRTTPEYLLQGGGCSFCSKKNPKTNDDFLFELWQVSGSKFTPIEKYAGSKTAIKVKCNDCEYVRNVTPSDLVNKRVGCPSCSRVLKKSTDIYSRELNNLYDNRYTVMGEYINALTKIDTRCNVCENIWGVRPNALLTKMAGCPVCKSSKGEKLVGEFLNNAKINYKKEFIFKDCRYIKPLRFDFAIFDEEDSLYCLIEYDGQQHFEESISKHFSEDDFRLNNLRDGIKNEYCKNNNIKLVRIPYYKIDSLVDILENELSTLLNKENN